MSRGFSGFNKNKKLIYKLSIGRYFVRQVSTHNFYYNTVFENKSKSLILQHCIKNETLMGLNSYCHKNKKNKSCLPNNGAFKAFPAINHNKLTLTRFSDLFRTTLKCNVLCIAAATIGFRFFIEFLHFKVHFVEQQKSRCKFLAPRSRALCVLVFSFGLLLSSILLLLQL